MSTKSELRGERDAARQRARYLERELAKARAIIDALVVVTALAATEDPTRSV